MFWLNRVPSWGLHLYFCMCQTAAVQTKHTFLQRELWHYCTKCKYVLRKIDYLFMFLYITLIMWAGLWSSRCNRCQKQKTLCVFCCLPLSTQNNSRLCFMSRGGFLEAILVTSTLVLSLTKNRTVKGRHCKPNSVYLYFILYIFNFFRFWINLPLTHKTFICWNQIFF